MLLHVHFASDFNKNPVYLLIDNFTVMVVYDTQIRPDHFILKEACQYISDSPAKAFMVDLWLYASF